MSRAAMQQALDAIEGSGCKADLMAAADALRAALAEQPQPVAWMVKDQGLYWTEEAAIRRADQFVEPLDVVPLYTTQPGPQPVADPTRPYWLALSAASQACATSRSVSNEACEALCAAIDRLADALDSPAPIAPQPLTIERLRDALVASRIIDPGAVEDSDDYDDGLTLHRIEALFRRLG